MDGEERGARGAINSPADTDGKDKLGLGGHVEVAGLLGLTAQADLIVALPAVLINVLLGTLEDDLALGLVGLEVRQREREGGLATTTASLDDVAAAEA